jgi:hypothetical protein
MTRISTIFFFFAGSTAPVGPGLFFSFMIISQLVGLLGRVMRSSRGRRPTQTQNKLIHTPNIHALSGIPTHNPGFRASEDSACLRPLGYCDRLRASEDSACLRLRGYCDRLRESEDSACLRPLGYCDRLLASEDSACLRPRGYCDRLRASEDGASLRPRGYCDRLRASEDSACLRPLGYRDRLCMLLLCKYVLRSQQFYSFDK